VGPHLGLALLAVGALGHVLSRRALTLAGSFFIAGILLFSGSLYALSLTGERPATAADQVLLSILKGLGIGGVVLPSERTGLGNW